MSKLYKTMQKKTGRSLLGVVLLSAFLFFSCMQQKNRVKNPPGYNLAAPQKFALPSSLTEISGLAFYKANPDIVYAHEDESGRVYHFKLGDKEVKHTKFAGKGDYEDIAICHEQVIMLRSDGALFIFPFSQLRAGKVLTAKTYDSVLPKGEYEGMYADEKTGLLYVLCKSCKADKKGSGTSGYIFKLLPGGNVQKAGSFTVNVETEKKKTKFMPSALAKNPITAEWYIISSVNKMLVITDEKWKVKDTYPLVKLLFPQPEGIVFDKQNNLYISNEGGLGGGTILKFTFKK